jgi:hypothetical protein
VFTSPPLPVLSNVNPFDANAEKPSPVVDSPFVKSENNL